MDRLLRMVMRRAMNMAINKGIDMGARRMTGARDGQVPTQDQKSAMKNARQSAKLMRRMTRI